MPYSSSQHSATPMQVGRETGVGKVVGLVTYPVKGCAGISMTEAHLTPAGLAHDRSFLVVDEDGTFRSQRSDPGLALIRPEISPGGDRLALHAPDVDAVDIAVDRDGTRRDVAMFRRPYRGIDQGAAVARWLSDVLGAGSRLVRVPPEHDRITDGATPGTSAFADSSPVHVLSRSSLADLNDRLTAAGGPSLPMNRFRPNIVVDGWDEPYREDEARLLRVGDAELAFAKPAIRCVVTTVDQSAGAKAGPEPLRTLATYRRVAEGGVAFGAKFSVLRTGRLAVGDEITVPSPQPPEPRG